MRAKYVGNKADSISVNIKNAEASVTIPLGAPVVVVLNGTDDGLAVVLPSTATDALQTTFGYGVSLQALTTGQNGEAMVFGYCRNVKLLRTRASSTDPYVAIVQGALLKAESVSNCLASAATNGASAFGPQAGLAASIASISSTTASTAVGFTSMATAFLRMM